MYKFSKLESGNMLEMARIQQEAFPGFASTQNTTPEQAAERMAETNSRPDAHFYGAFQGDKLLGGYILWDFEMNMRQTMIKAGGIGGVAVDLGHKKQKVAREIIRHFHSTMCSRGAHIALLYPFNSGFYYRMGYGFGTILHQFTIKPEDLPGGPTKAHIVRLTEHDAPAVTRFYNARAMRTHGLITKTESEFAKRLKNPAGKIFAYVDGEVRGYVVFNFKKGSEESGLANDLVVTELLYDSPEVFAELMAFVKSQSDQARYAIINLQDDGLLHTIPDPRNYTDRVLHTGYQEHCRTGHGIMYRICDVEAFIEDIAGARFGELDMVLQVNVSDNFIQENDRPFVLKFSGGQCRLADSAAPDAVLDIGIADFSSLMMGAANLTSLVRYGKARLSDMEYLGMISQGFALDEKPVCLTYF